MKDYLIAPSILSANFARLYEETDAVIKAGADIIHFDVMDNHYVPNLTVGPMVCQSLRDEGVTALIDVHLMIQPVDSMISAFAQAGAGMISFHPEASTHVHRSLMLVKSHGCKAGLALNPATPICVLNHVLDELDFILVMSVNPGFSGQCFIPAIFDKIKQVHTYVQQHAKHPIRIEVDGGIQIENIADVAQAGADIFVAGSAIFSKGNYAHTISQMRDQLTLVRDSNN